MKTMKIHRSILVWGLLLVAATATRPTSTFAAVQAPASAFDQDYRRLQDLARDPRVDPVTSEALLALLAEAKENVADQQGFVGTTEDVVQALLGTGNEYIQSFTSEYSNTFQQVTKFEWHIDPNPLKKCNKNFSCEWGGVICIVITWSDGHGSGGINCISQTTSRS